MAELQTGNPNILSSRVRGTAVYNPEGEHLGSIDDLVIGKRDGKVKYAILSFGGFLGIGEDYHPLPWDTLLYDEEKGGYVVSLSREQLESAPRYANAQQPDWDDLQWGRALYDYYGVPPYF